MSLRPEQQARLRELFDSAVELDPPSRAAFVAEACADDSELRAELQELLRAHESPAPWLDRPLLDDSPPEAPVVVAGRQIGAFHVVRRIGSGGMGDVYLAERPIGRIRQQVALKIIRPAFVTNAEMLRRFEQEREILASLDHPNIARLLDVGSTTEGVPYLVMEYVEGEPIDAWCKVRDVPLPDRLDLFRRACAAIAYAQSRGVVHRDLKPANILVAADRTLKVLDFGIAKVLREGSDTMTMATRTGAGLMTIEYASPEQILGEEAGPQTDVYSLGVVLYEILTGRRPYRTEGMMLHAIAQAICEQEPIVPSEAVAEAGRTQLRRALAGDLDAILLKALRKRPQWRYESPAAFSEDIRRHTAGERVVARTDTIRYRLERIVHHILYPANVVFHTHGMIMWTAGLMAAFFLFERHQIRIGAQARPHTALDATILVGWIVWSSWERQRMERAGRFSALDRLSWTMFTVIAIVLGAITVVSAWRRFLPAEVVAVFWNAGLSVGLLVVGLQASRLMMLGGVALLVSAVLAMVDAGSLYVWLAGGMLTGMVIPGLIFTMQGLSGRRPWRTGDRGQTPQSPSGPDSSLSARQ